MPAESEACITGPRCLHPVEWRELNAPRDDYPAVCWRPADHPTPGRHLSRHAIETTRLRRRNRKRRRTQELAA